MAERLLAVFSHMSKNSPHFSPCNSVRQTVQPSSTRSFQYTLDNPKLTHQQRIFYEKNGYFVIKNLVSEEHLDKYRDEFTKICNCEANPSDMVIMQDVAIAKSRIPRNERNVTKIQHFLNNEVLFGYCRLPEILDYVECFTGPDVISVHTMLINKPPDLGNKSSRHPLHQDLLYFPFRPEDRLVCSWTAMQHVYHENGCLVVVPGSHKGELIDHAYPKWEGGVNKYYHGIKTYDTIDLQTLTYLEMQPGDTVFFHPLLIHGSGRNQTEGFRKSISGHYAGSDCHYINTDGTTHESIANEFEKYWKGKFNMESFIRTKARLVRGNRNSLS